MNNINLYSKLVSLPDEVKAEAGDFIDFLANKSKKKSATIKPKFGSGKGMFVVKPGFDQPLEDFKEYMY